MRKLKYLLLIVLISFIGIFNVNAFSITGTTSTTVGSTISVRVEASGLTGRFDVVSSDNSVLSGGKSVWLENNTTTLSFAANKVGTASITVKASDVADENGNAFTGTRILYVTVKEKSSGSTSGGNSSSTKPSIDVNKKYSDNNNLKSLSIEGYELQPVFNKDTLEYKVDLKVDTTKVNVLAEQEDSKATIKGTGEVTVNDGANTIIVTVVAENGNEKQYKINATVLEPDPINVEINKKKYTVVRKGKLENVPSDFVETKIKIKDQDIIAYKSEAAKLTLVGLKDEEGKISLFIYNASSKEYKAFKEIKSNGASLIILEQKEVPSNDYEKTEFIYNDIKISGFKLKEDKIISKIDKKFSLSTDKYYIVYAKNLLTGNEDYYLYDKEESTFQRYYIEYDKYKNKQVKMLFYLSALLFGISGLTILIWVIRKLFISREKKIKKYQRKIDKLKRKLNRTFDEEEYEESYDLSKLSDKPEIKKIEDDEYVVPKKSRKEKLREIREAKEKLDMSRSSYRRVSLDDDE